MGVTKLISQGKAYDELFDTADYIQTDDGVGIYPAYENLLRNGTGFTNTVIENKNEGYFVANVPTGQNSAFFQVSQSLVEVDKSYTAYFECETELEEVTASQVGAGSNKYYEKLNVKSFIVDFNKTDISGTFFTFHPKDADKDKNILIKYTLVPKKYPKKQEWAGSKLLSTLSGLEKSYSLQFKNFLNQQQLGESIVLFENNAGVDRFGILRFYVTPQDLRYIIRVWTDDTGGSIVDIPTNIGSANSSYTFSLNGNVLSVYQNGLIVATELTQWTTPIKTVRTISRDDVGYDFYSLFYSTEESTGYTQGTEPSITPTCKLGLAGEEIDLPRESRIQGTANRIVKELESESANATLHTQFIATKDNLNVSYDVISEEDTKLIKDIEALQWQNNARLNYIYNEESGNLITKTVKAKVVAGGNRLLRNRYFDNGLTIEMRES